MKEEKQQLIPQKYKKKKKKEEEEEEEETENFNRPITRSEIESVSENLSINKTEKALRDMYHS